MPLSTVSLPQAWNIPVAQGVPTLGKARDVGASATASTLLGQVITSQMAAWQDSQWGLFTQDNTPVLTAGRVRALGVQSQARISDAPMENGAFLSYNKVRLPGQFALAVLCDGTLTARLGSGQDILDDLNPATLLTSLTGLGGAEIRRSFLAVLDGLVADVNLYHVTTPEATYSDVNVLGYQLRREAQHGLYLLWAELALQQVQVSAVVTQSSAFGTTTQPWGAAAQNGGNVQGTDVTGLDAYAMGAVY